MTEYAILLIICLSVPLWQSFNRSYGLRGKFLIVFKTMVIVSIPFLIWDVIATYRGHWHFNEKYASDILIINLPIEEVLFFFVIPFCCVFSWNAFKTLEK